MLLLVPLTAALVPLLITPGALAYFDITPKIALLLFGMALMLSQVRANTYNVRTLLSEGAGKWLVGLLAALWMAHAVATLASSNRLLSLNGGSWRRMGFIPETGLLLFVVLAVSWLTGQNDRVRMLLRAAAGSGALAAGYGIAQYFGWDPLLPARAYQAGEGEFTIVRPPGTLGHADYFAAWLVVVLFFAVSLHRMEERRWYRTAALGVIGLAALAIVLSGSRAAMLGAAVGGVTLLLARRDRIRMRGVAFGLVCIAGLALFFFSPAGLKLRARLHWSLEDAQGGARLLLWRDSLRMSAHRPLAGFGPESFGTEFPRFESIQLASKYPDFYHESAHNIFLDSLTEQGAIGLIALLGMCALGAWGAIRACRSQNPLGPPLAAAFVGLLVTQQFIAFVFTTALYFYLLVALLVVIAWGSGKPLAQGRHAAPWVLVLVGWVSIVIAALSCVYAVRLLRSDHAFAEARESIASGDIARASEQYRAVLSFEPMAATADLSYSRAMQQAATRTPIFSTRLAARQQALDAGIRAVRRAEDRQNAWYNLAILLAGQNDAAGAEQALRNSIAWAPHWFKPHWALARLLALSGRGSEALEEGRMAIEYDGGRDQEVAETWKQLQIYSR
jgi:O-antigen ligase